MDYAIKAEANTFWCKRCLCSSDTLYRINSNSYCNKCVEVEDKGRVEILNQNRERVI